MTSRGATASRNGRKARPAIEHRTAPDVLGDDGVVQAVADMLGAIQRRRVQVQVRQKAWGAGDDDLAVMDPNDPDPKTFAELYRIMGEEERRLIEAYPEQIDKVEELLAARKG